MLDPKYISVDLTLKDSLWIKSTLYRLIKPIQSLLPIPMLVWITEPHRGLLHNHSKPRATTVFGLAIKIQKAFRWFWILQSILQSSLDH